MNTRSESVLWLAIHLPRLNTDRLIRAARAPEDQPFAVYAKHANAFLLTGVNARAAALGLRREMPLADARAIHPALVVAEAEPEEDARTLDRIAAWCERFTPVVVLDPPEGLFLDVTGCAHLFGGEEAMREQIVARLAAQGFSARAALAPTPGAAWALARFGGGGEALRRLPIEALRLDEEAASLLRRLGLKTIGQLIAAPRSSFTARAGVRAMQRLDQALGRAPEALTPRRPPPPVFALRRFLEPLFTLDAILEATAALCADAVARLDQRGAGARRLQLHLFGVDGRDRVVEIGASRPEREAKALLRLFREKLSVIAENLNAEFGIESARLDIVAAERIGEAARTLVAVEEAQAGAEKIAAIADLLIARLGARRVLRPKLNDTHAPERAGGWRTALGTHASLPPCGGGAGEGGRAKRGANGADAHRCENLLSPDSVMRRPLTLFARPQPIDAIATVPDGPPIRFRWRRVLREVARAEGPERIAGDWLNDAPTRDYYRVEDKDGRRYWLYREGFYGASVPRWYLHGLFA